MPTERTDHRARGSCSSALGTSFFTCSCEGRQHFLASCAAREFLAAHLRSHAERHRIEVHAWVFMSNHVHLLLSAGDLPLREWMTRWKRDAVHRLRRDCRDSIPAEAASGRFWLKGLGYDRAIWSWQEFNRKLAYCESNPVRAGLVVAAAEYRTSSAFDRLHAQRADFPVIAPPPVGLVDLREGVRV